MGNKTREKVNKERARIEKQRGIVNRYLYNQNKLNKSDKGKTNAAMDNILETTIFMIENKEPISDDILLLCWKYSIATNEDPLKSKLWLTIDKCISDVLTIPLQKRWWFWFEQYMFHSSIWYESTISEEMKRKIKLERSKSRGS